MAIGAAWSNGARMPGRTRRSAPHGHNGEHAEHGDQSAQTGENLQDTVLESHDHIRIKRVPIHRFPAKAGTRAMPIVIEANLKIPRVKTPIRDDNGASSGQRLGSLQEAD